MIPLVKRKNINYLAHLLLSGNNPKIKVGNFIGDFIKGKQYETLDPMIGKGVLLHREIDFYTDNHAIVALSKDRLREKYRHYSGVIVDMFYDHYLAKNFELYSSTHLTDFAQMSYQIVESYWDVIPPRGQKMLPYMIRGNWLVNYGKREGIHRALQGLSRRTKFDSKLEYAIQDLQEFDSEFESEFMSFFKEIEVHISKFREDLINSSQ
ncbi:ACP phosphodiesterase [Roseivirga sp.]|uniref:acyl carrier protein phosphodiesterase n=1 Tax=Roseivirga sp. TaxID=1964215 RepID=UPI003B8CD683